MRIPEQLIEAFGNGKGVLWLGAGCSVGSGLPSWSTLTSQMLGSAAAELSLDGHDLESLNSLEIAQLFRATVGGHEYYSFLRNNLSARTLSTVTKVENRTLLAVCALANHLWPSPGIVLVSTNFDHLLEETMLLHHGKRVRSILSNDDLATTAYDEELTVLKPNGDIDNPESIVLTLQDYCEFRLRKGHFLHELSQLMANRTILFVGYGLGDFTFNTLLGELKLSLGPFTRRAYAITGGPSGVRKEVLRSLGIEAIETSNFDEVPSILNTIATPHTRARSLLSPQVPQIIGQWRLLWVDDDDLFSESVRSLADKNQWTGFEYARNASDAIAAVQTRRFDIVVTDIVLGGLQTGFDVIEAARESEFNSKSIIGVVSAFADSTQYVSRSVKLGADIMWDISTPLDELLLRLFQMKRVADRTS